MDDTPTSGYWQHRVSGIPGSAQYIADGSGNCTLLGVTRQLVGETWTGAGEFQYCGTLAPWDLPANAAMELTKAGQVLSGRMGLRGLFGVDFIFDGERAWVVEVNPRITAAMEVVERVTGSNLPRQTESHLDLSNRVSSFRYRQVLAIYYP